MVFAPSSLILTNYFLPLNEALVKKAVMFNQLLQQAFDNIHEDKHELALLSIMPIFDKACKKTWPTNKVGERFRKGVTETENIITFLMCSGSSLMTNCIYGDLKLPKIVYKYLRNTIIHEGEMPPNVSFTNEPKIIIDEGNVIFPKQFVIGFLVAAIGFECYKNESTAVTQFGKLYLKGEEYLIKDLVGNHAIINNVINKKYGIL